MVVGVGADVLLHLYVLSTLLIIDLAIFLTSSLQSQQFPLHFLDLALEGIIRTLHPFLQFPLVS